MYAIASARAPVAVKPSAGLVSKAASNGAPIAARPQLSLSKAKGFGQQQARRASLVCKADEEPAAGETEPTKPTGEEEDPKKEGQGLANFTAGISLILGIGYLALVSAMDRGAMMPPPPEAFGP